MSDSSGRKRLDWAAAVLWILLLVFGLFLPSILGRAPLFVEDIYARGLFPWIAQALAVLGRATSVSLAQLCIALAGTLLLFELVRIGKSIREFGKRFVSESLPNVLFRWLRVVTVVVWTFHLVWGANYARPSLHTRMGLPKSTPTSEQLARLSRRLAEETNHAYSMALRFEEAAADTAFGTQLLIEEDVLWLALATGYKSVTPRLQSISFANPKLPTPAGTVLSKLGISGIYFPFTGEASVNGRMPQISIPFVAAHEMAHQRGIAREDEANALAYLSCRQAGLWITRYSGALAAFRRSQSALYRAEPDSARAIAKVLHAEPRRDLVVISEFWRRQRGVASTAAAKMNDTYLKTNAQADGVQSYGRMVDLLVALNELDMLR